MKVPAPEILSSSAIVDALPLPAWVCDETARAIHFSPAWERLTGSNGCDDSALGFASSVHADDLARLLQRWEVARSGGAPLAEEVRVRTHDGSYAWHLLQAAPIRNAAEAVIGWVGTAIDVDERRRLEAGLAERDALLRYVEDRHRLIGESIPGTTWTALPDGQLDHVSIGPQSPARVPAVERLGDRWLELVHPDERENVRRLWTTALATGEPYEATFRARMADGGYRWQLVRAAALRDDRGEIVRWVGINVDVEERVRAVAEREKFVALAEQSGDIVLITDAAGAVVYANPAALTFLDATLEEIAAMHFLEFFPPQDVAFAESQIVPALEREGRWTGEFRLRNLRTGRPLPILCNAFALRDAAGNLTGFAAVSRDIESQQRVDIGIRALAAAGKAMHNSLDVRMTVQNIADSLVAGFCEMCSVEMVEPDGTIRTDTLATRDPAHAPIARDAAIARNRGIFPGHPILRAVQRGESTVLATLPRAFLQSTGLHEYVGPKQGMLDLRSVIFVPVRSSRDGTIVGCLSCGMGGDDPRGAYTEADLPFAQEIALRAGIAYDNARSFERAARIAAELQAASLPAALPACAGLKLHADYRPATEESAIGGDWYDAFALSDGRIAITVGDVVGHGLQAAIRMTKMRQAMQSAAMIAPDPRVMLGVANRTLRMLEPDVYATAMAAIYDPGARRMVVASAGHPGPAVARHDGSASEFEYPGFMLGLTDDEAYDVHTIDLEPGDAVVFFTDGLIEAHRNAERGSARLREAIVRPDVTGAENAAYALVERVLDGAAVRDDIAVVVALVTNR